MKHDANVRKFRLLMLAGAVALSLGAGAKYAAQTHKMDATQPIVINTDALKASALLADGSESTGGSKPTKPNHG